LFREKASSNPNLLETGCTAFQFVLADKNSTASVQCRRWKSAGLLGKSRVSKVGIVSALGGAVAGFVVSLGGERWLPEAGGGRPPKAAIAENEGEHNARARRICP
jgi:hypothetical protein